LGCDTDKDVQCEVAEEELAQDLSNIKFVDSKCERLINGIVTIVVKLKLAKSAWKTWLGREQNTGASYALLCCNKKDINFIDFVHKHCTLLGNHFINWAAVLFARA
jgi:hypothetical protein